ncbi:hypothetical protein RHA65_09785 [Providencia rettgeri]|nr:MULTISPECIES: hypothetical protein [Providencia]MDR9614928.1 hypothetical protein [Providencia rettgeri]
MNIHRNLGASHNPMQIGPPSITIHVAPKGSPIYNHLGEDIGSTSQWGHTYISIRGVNPVTHNYEQISMGLSPGEDWGTSKDNLSFNDHVRYKSASTLTITSNNQQFFSHSLIAGTITSYSHTVSLPTIDLGEISWGWFHGLSL